MYQSKYKKNQKFRKGLRNRFDSFKKDWRDASEKAPDFNLRKQLNPETVIETAEVQGRAPASTQESSFLDYIDAPQIQIPFEEEKQPSMFEQEAGF